MKESFNSAKHFESHASSPVPKSNGRTRASEGGEEREPYWPRLLVIDPTGIGERSATGQIKKNLLKGWSEESFLQICTTRKAEFPDGPPFGLIHSPEGAGHARGRPVSEAEARRAAEAFRPQVVYYRPMLDEQPELHELVTTLLTQSRAPLVTHLMDDWPARLRATDPARVEGVERALRETLGRSEKVLSISDKMSKVFGRRYGVELESIANGVDVDTYRAASASAREGRLHRAEIVLRYCGALAKDMTFDAVVNVARAVDALDGEIPVRLEVYTMKAWHRVFSNAVTGLRGVRVLDLVPDDDYPALLAGADILVIGYNFDPESLRYTRLSLPNKLPECLASGAPLLAVGPAGAAAIEYVASRELARCVSDSDQRKLIAAIRRLALDRRYAQELAERAQAWAFQNLDLAVISERFKTILRQAADRDPSPGYAGDPAPRA